MRHTRWIAGLLTLAAASACGCAGTAAGVVRHEGRAAGHISMPLKGVYRATIIPPFDFIGPISGRISAEPTENGFIASTRPGIAWDMIGGVEGFLGSIFANFVFPRGTIGTWTSSVPTAESPGEGWFGVGGIKNAGVRTRITSSAQPVELLTDRRKVGLIVLEPDSPDSGPLRDYQGLAEDIALAMTEQVYDPAVARSSAVRAYISQVRYNARLARDDVEFIFGTVAAARNHIKFTMPLAFPKGDAKSRATMAGWSPSEVTTIRANLDRRTGLAWIRVDAFLSAADVDRVFAEVLAWNPKGLIIDVRSTPGVTLASLRVLSWLCADPVDAGTWFGPARRKELLASAAQAATVEVSSAALVEEIDAELDRDGAAHVVVRPESARYNGPVAVLTSRRTSASAESLVLALKNSGRAKVVGQPTSGRPFLSRPIPLRDGWVFWLAAADHKPSVGDRISTAGIKPDIETSSRESASRAAEKYLLETTGATADKGAPEEGGSLLSPFFKAAGHGEKK